MWGEKLIMEAAGLSKKGLRDENQDSYLINLNKGIFIVADGMGGHKAGQVASSIAINTANQFFSNSYHTYDKKENLVLDAMIEANQQILKHASCNPDTMGMGTTMTFMYWQKGLVYIGHIGDSRAYMISQGEITQLTNDHSYVGELLRRGGITEEDAANHPKRNLLMRALGYMEDVEVDIIQKNINDNDYILLCTDGLFNVLDKEEIKDIILNHSVKEAVEKLVNIALERGGHDNITAVLVKCY